jgi:hypothetical protein
MTAAAPPCTPLRGRTPRGQSFFGLNSVFFYIRVPYRRVFFCFLCCCDSTQGSEFLPVVLFLGMCCTPSQMTIQKKHPQYIDILQGVHPPPFFSHWHLISNSTLLLHVAEPESEPQRAASFWYNLCRSDNAAASAPSRAPAPTPNLGTTNEDFYKVLLHGKQLT